jgi:hypothetical protein
LIGGWGKHLIKEGLFHCNKLHAMVFLHIAQINFTGLKKTARPKAKKKIFAPSIDCRWNWNEYPQDKTKKNWYFRTYLLHISKWVLKININAFKMLPLISIIKCPWYESRSTPFAYAPFTPVPILMNDMWHLKNLMGEIKPQYRFNILWLLSFPLLSLHSTECHRRSPPCQSSAATVYIIGFFLSNSPFLIYNFSGFAIFFPKSFYINNLNQYWTKNGVNQSYTTKLELIKVAI